MRREQYAGDFRMSDLEEKLARFGFFRCHRSYIVNMQKVVELVKWTRNSYSLRLAGYEKTDVPLSKGKIQELRSSMSFRGKEENSYEENVDAAEKDIWTSFTDKTILLMVLTPAILASSSGWCTLIPGCCS